MQHLERAQWLPDDILRSGAVDAFLKLEGPTADELTQKAVEKENFVFIFIFIHRRTLPLEPIQAIDVTCPKPS